MNVATEPIPAPNFSEPEAATPRVNTKAASPASAAPSPEPGPGEPLSNIISRVEKRYNPAGLKLASPPAEAFTRPRPSPPAEPLPDQVALSGEHGGQQVVALRIAFQEALGDVEFKFSKNNRIEVTKFTPTEVKNITSLIFDSVFNANGYDRANAIMSSYRASKESTNPVAATVRAARLALDETLPSDVREFYSLYASSTKSTTSFSAVEQMLSCHEKYKLYNAYLVLVDQPSDDLANLIKAAGGGVTKQGQGLRTVLLTYLATELNLSRGQLRNLLQETQCIHILVASFGVGVLAFVPRGIINM